MNEHIAFLGLMKDGRKKDVYSFYVMFGLRRADSLESVKMIFKEICVKVKQVIKEFFHNVFSFLVSLSCF